MWMWTRLGLISLVVLLLISSCGGGDVGPPPETLIGTWNANSVELVSMANPAVQVDVVRDLGATVTLILEANDDFTLTVTYTEQEPGGSWLWGANSEVKGTWSSTDVLTLQTSPTGNFQFEIDLNGDSLILTEADSSFDFDGNGTPDDADLSLDLTRG